MNSCHQRLKNRSDMLSGVQLISREKHRGRYLLLIIQHITTRVFTSLVYTHVHLLSYYTIFSKYAPSCSIDLLALAYMCRPYNWLVHLHGGWCGRRKGVNCERKKEFSFSIFLIVFQMQFIDSCLFFPSSTYFLLLSHCLIKLGNLVFQRNSW